MARVVSCCVHNSERTTLITNINFTMIEAWSAYSEGHHNAPRSTYLGVLSSTPNKYTPLHHDTLEQFIRSMHGMASFGPVEVWASPCIATATMCTGRRRPEPLGLFLGRKKSCATIPAKSCKHETVRCGCMVCMICWCFFGLLPGASSPGPLFYLKKSRVGDIRRAHGQRISDVFPGSPSSTMVTPAPSPRNVPSPRSSQGAGGAKEMSCLSLGDRGPTWCHGFPPSFRASFQGKPPEHLVAFEKEIQ